MVNDGERPRAVNVEDFPTLEELMDKGFGHAVANAPRFIRHEGKVYDLTKTFDQNCIKVHARKLRHRRDLENAKARAEAGAESPSSRKVRRAKATILRRALRIVK